LTSQQFSMSDFANFRACFTPSTVDHDRPGDPRCSLVFQSPSCFTPIPIVTMTNESCCRDQKAPLLEFQGCRSRIFHQESEIFTHLRHLIILLFIGACISNPFQIITEYMFDDSLSSWLC
jgi:hypothetical protein